MKYYRVYLKSTWAGSWVQAVQLEPVRSTVMAAPGLGSAILKMRYGSGMLEDGTALADGSLIASQRKKYVQIRSSDYSNFSSYTAEFTGVIPADEFRMLGDDGTVKSAEQFVKAYSMGYLLDTQLDTAYAEPLGGGTAVLIDHMPVFNTKNASGQVEGNRSASKHTIDTKQSYVFAGGDGCGTWSYADIIEYLLAHCQTATATFTLSCPAALLTALGSMTGVFDFNGMTLRGALDTLLNRARGIGWGADVDSLDVPYISVWSLLDTSLTVGTMTMPAHLASDRYTVNMWNVDAHADLRVTADEAQVYDKIIARGARIKTCCTFSLGDSTLEKAWTAAEETAYEEAACNTTGYSSLSTKAKAEKNDRFRATDRFRRVFSAFRVPVDWDWKIGSAFANPAWNGSTDTLNESANGAYWNAEKRFYPFLPFKEGWDYSGTSAVDKNPDDIENEYRKLFAVVKNSDNTYSYAESRKEAAASVRPMSSQMGVEVSFRPRHLAAKNDFSGAEPSATDADFSTNACDYNDMKVTAMVETDQYLQLVYTGATTETVRTKKISIPDAELWYVTGGTVVDIDADGNLVTYGGTSKIIRDDRDTLRSILAAAVAWYGKRRNRLTINCGIVDTFTHIGMMIDDVNVENGGSSAGTTVTEITIDYAASAMTIRTDHGELNFAAIHSAGGGGVVGVPSLKAAGRQINKLQSEVVEIKKQQDKAPLRIETTQAGTPFDVGIFKITAVGTWGSYTAARYRFDSGISAGSGVSRFESDGESVTIINMAEDATTATNELEAGDWLVGFEVKNDAGGRQWVGWSPRYSFWDV